MRAGMVAAGLLFLALALTFTTQSARANRSIYCGGSFSISIPEGTQVSSRSPVEDFVLHKVQFPDGRGLVIYEGYAPQLTAETHRYLHDNHPTFHIARDKPNIADYIFYKAPLYVVLHVKKEWLEAGFKPEELALKFTCNR